LKRRAYHPTEGMHLGKRKAREKKRVGKPGAGKTGERKPGEGNPVSDFLCQFDVGN
jgi:hypothetical protein